MSKLLQVTFAVTTLALLMTGCSAAAEPSVVTLVGSEQGCADGSDADARFRDGLPFGRANA